MYIILSIRETTGNFYVQMSLSFSQDVIIMYIVFVNIW